jgi:hypothetical protein
MSVINRQFDMVIGKDSALKMGYFTPFTNGLLNCIDKNEAILSHEEIPKRIY